MTSDQNPNHSKFLKITTSIFALLELSFSISALFNPTLSITKLLTPPSSPSALFNPTSSVTKLLNSHLSVSALFSPPPSITRLLNSHLSASALFSPPPSITRLLNSHLSAPALFSPPPSITRLLNSHSSASSFFNPPHSITKLFNPNPSASALFSPSPSVLAFLRPPPSISTPPDITVGLPTPHRGPPVRFDEPQLSDPTYYRLELHSEVIKYCESELIQGNYFHAVLEAVKGLAQRIRDKSGIQLDGVPLVNKVFSIEKPILAFNTLKTQSEKSDHNGSVMLLKGCFGTIRNPYAHEPKILCTTESYAREYLVTISVLHRKLDECILMDPGRSA